jgi:hypothetical protein
MRITEENRNGPGPERRRIWILSEERGKILERQGTALPGHEKSQWLGPRRRPGISPLSENLIRERVYKFYVDRGRIDGYDVADWFEAKRELCSEEQGKNHDRPYPFWSGADPGRMIPERAMVQNLFFFLVSIWWKPCFQR